MLLEGSGQPNFIAHKLQLIVRATEKFARRIVASIDGDPVKTFVLANDDAEQLFLLQDHIRALIEFLSFAWHYAPDPYKRGLSTALTSLTVLFLVTSCATGGERPALPTDVPPVAAQTEQQTAQPVGQPATPVAKPTEVPSANQPEPALANEGGPVVAPTTTTGETPTLLAALRTEGVGGAILTSEQLAESASTFAQFIGLEGLTASQPELREGDPDFLARTIVFFDSGGEQAGMVVAISETDQFYLWVDANGKAVCQPTNKTQPLEGKECDVAVAQYWTVYRELLQDQAAAEQAEVEQSQSWTVLTQEEILLRLGDPESNTKIRNQAKYVLGADSLSDEAFASELGGHMIEMTTDVDGKPRTNMVVGVVEGKTDLSQVHAAITAAREQGLNLLDSTILYVTNDGNSTLIWHTGAFKGSQKDQWLKQSYGGLTTFMGFFAHNPSTGEITFRDLTLDNYLVLGMGTADDRANKRIAGPAKLQYQLVLNPDQSTTMIIVSPLDKAWEFVPDSTAPKGGNWKSYATPDTRENGAAEIMSSLEKIKVVISELDTLTAQSAEPNWHEAELLDYQGSKYLEVPDTSRDGKTAYLVYVEIDETTTERLYGPVVILNSGNYNPNAIAEIQQNQPLTNRQLALDTIRAIQQSGLAKVMLDNNILVICGNNLLTFQQSSHTMFDYSRSPINRIYFNLKNFNGDSDHLAKLAAYALIGEVFETLGDMYFSADKIPPTGDFFFKLNPEASNLPYETDVDAHMLNALYNAIDWLKTAQHRFDDNYRSFIDGALRNTKDHYASALGL